MKTDKSEPAFPHTYPDQNDETMYQCTYHGMSLRDWFAGQALIGMMASVEQVDNLTWMKNMTHEMIATKFAHDAYMTADAMIREREK